MICRICEKDKEYFEYYKSSIQKRDYICKICSVTRNKIWRKHKKDSNDIPTRYKYSKATAKRSGKAFSLSLTEYGTLVCNPCHYCGESVNGYGVGLDRINNDPAIGYKIGNVLPCCGTCNNIRGKALTVQEMEVAMKAVLRYRKGK
jgi:hypothetical protein